MKIKRIFGPRKALRRAALALLALFLCEIAAALPAVSESVRLCLAVLGYFSFVILLRAALLAWRRDWEDLWRADLRSQAISRVMSFSIRKHWEEAS